MKKNKILTLCLVSVLALSALTGCGKNKKNDSNIVDTVDRSTNYILSEGTTPISSHTGLSFDMYANTKDNYTIYGETEILEHTLSYDSTVISTKLLGNEHLKIVYTAEIPHTLVLLYDEKTSGTITINEQTYNVYNGEFEIELESGQYTIKSDGIDLYYILVNEINHTTTLDFPDGSQITFNLDDVEVSEENGATIYKFWDGSEIKVNKNGTVEILNEGISGIFSM